MGHKVDPNILRIGIIKTWDSKWYAGRKKYAKLLHDDLKIRDYVGKKLVEGMIGKLEILRSANQVVVNIFTGKPGTMIGKGGEEVEKLKHELEKMTGDRFLINIKEIKKPNLESKIMAESIARQIEKRINYRRAAKMAIEKALEAGAIGAKVHVSGRLNGVEISRSEFYSKGKVPLHTLRADIDYAFHGAKTSYGVIGVKVWIYKGLVFKRKEEELATHAQ